MGWSNDQFDGTLVIPTGATSGARIVLDGTTGQILVYDANDNIVFRIQATPDAEFAQAPGASAHAPDGSYANLVAGTTFGAGLYYRPSDDSPYTWGQGAILADWDAAAPDDIPYVTFRSPYETSNPNGSAGVAQITLYGNSASGGTTQVAMSADSLTLGGVDQGRGILDYTDIAANTATTTTTETIAVNTPTLTFEQGRAYQIIIKGYVQSSAAADVVQVRARKTGTAGQQLIASMSGYTIPGANQNVPFYLGTIVRNDTGGDINDDIVLTYVRNSGAGNVRIAADATHHAYIEVRDIGASADYASAPELA